MIDPTATHLPVLEQLFQQRKIYSVLEFGCGLYSTTLFAEKKCDFTSIEMQHEQWYERMTKLLPFADIRLRLGPTLWKREPLRDWYELVFVDGHRDSRVDCLMWAKDHTNLIVAHDTQRPEYQWERADMNGFKEAVHKDLTPWTTVWVRE